MRPGLSQLGNPGCIARFAAFHIRAANLVKLVLGGFDCLFQAGTLRQLLGGLVGWFVIKPVNAALGRFFRWFNEFFDWMTKKYGRAVAGVLRLSVVVLIVYGGLLALTYYSFTKVPKAPNMPRRNADRAELHALPRLSPSRSSRRRQKTGHQSDGRFRH